MAEAVNTWSVSELSSAIKGTLEKTFGEVRVRGELGRVTKAASGHMYFDLKDEASLINGVWFKGRQRKVPDMAEGLEVIVSGRISTYPARSNYQLIVTSVEPAGVGALLKLIEERKKKLAAEGLFDEDKKRKLPYLPRTIGIITSPTGAVIHDMLHRFRERFLPHIIVWPVQVQGDGAAAQVVEAIKGFNAQVDPKPDLLIIARGGGSVEDLMPFNDEALVRAVAASSIPTISAIGHETDWTLIDLAADVRAPTPTGAAEFAVPVKAELEATVMDLAQRLRIIPQRLIEQLAQKLDERSLRLGRGLQSWLQVRRLQLAKLQLRSPRELLARQRDRLNLLGQRLTLQSALRSLEPQRQKLQRLGEKLEVLSYRNTLNRGFAVALDNAGHPVIRAANAPQDMQLRFADGDVSVTRK